MHSSRFPKLKTTRWMGIISAFLLAPPLFLQLPARSQGASPRDLIQSGVDAYIKSGPSAAFSAWFKGTFTEKDIQSKLQADDLSNKLKTLDAQYGALEGFDVIFDLNVGARARLLYIILYYSILHCLYLVYYVLYSYLVSNTLAGSSVDKIIYT